MNAVNLIFEVHARIPSWISHVVHNMKNHYTDNRYRIFVNNDLIVERNWIWNNDTFLKESIWVVSGFVDYNVRLEPVAYNPAQIKFSLKKVNEQNDISYYTDNQLELSFKV
jgi:hypothetical protein